MKKVVLSIIILTVVIKGFAQSYVRLNNYWDKTYIVNPASVNTDYLAEFNVITRQQWLGFTGAPKTLFLSGTVYIDDMYTQFGMRMLRDEIGYSATTDIDLTYAYSMRLNIDWRLRLGLGLSFQSLTYDVSKISSPTPGDPTVFNRLLNQNDINSDLGFEIKNKFWRFGFCSQNVFSLFSPVETNFINTNIGYGMYRDYSHEYVNLGFGVSAVQYRNLYQMEFNVTSYFKMTNQSSPFSLGLTYRTWSEVGASFGIELFKNVHVSYNYDYNFGAISTNSYGSHEIMLTYNIDKVFKCNNCWY